MIGRSSCHDRCRAVVFVRGLNFQIVARAGCRLQGHTSERGARAPASVAGRGVRLDVLSRAVPGAQTELVTPIGYKTAVRALPRLLAVLPADDARRLAANMLAASAESLGAVGGAWSEGGDTKGGQSDGGVTTRIKHSARLRLAEAVVNKWPIDLRHGNIQIMPDLVVLPVVRMRGARKEIKAFTLLMMVCVDGLDLSDVLLAHGWTVHSKHTRRLADATWAMLADLADAMVGARDGGLG